MKHIFDTPFNGIQVAVATPRSLPNANSLKGRVVILDLAFAHSKPSGRHPSITHKLIEQLGDRLALFLDHHDSDFHEDFIGHTRFILATKAEHGACPEMITPSLVERIGKVDSVLCHGDFDGLASAAKWILGGAEPYEGCDHDAWCIDTRLDIPSELGVMMDRALRAHFKDASVKEVIIRFLLSKARDQSLLQKIKDLGEEAKYLEECAERLASSYQLLSDRVVYVDTRSAGQTYDKTHLLLLGQTKAQVAVVHSDDTITFAAPFNSGINFLKLFQVSGGMPTVLSLPPHRLRGALVLLGIDPLVAKRIGAV
jgi:hypothetical protein